MRNRCRKGINARKIAIRYKGFIVIAAAVIVIVILVLISVIAERNGSFPNNYGMKIGFYKTDLL